MKTILISIFTICLLFNGMSKGGSLSSNPLNADIQKEITLIKAADYIITHFGDSIWENISSTPLRILMITDSLEYLFNHNNPDDSFEWFKYDSLLNSNIYVRKRRFPPFLRATFPAVNGIDCIVVGDPKNTQMSDEDWIVMLLHEHFHLYQGIHPNYNENIAVLAQKISGDSDNWMLDYDFPYNDATLNKLFKEYSNSLLETFISLNKNDLKEKMERYVINQAEIRNHLTSHDYSYFQFQVWQEGIATYTEYKYLNALNNNSKYFHEKYALDFTLKNEDLITAYASGLLNSNLQKNTRNLFYAIGLLKGIIMDAANPEWKTDYFSGLNVE
ncbi:MAG: hypothetical protein EA361_00670 [Bacteroidetes bacterium]|nr:MAG: hypothetical protein EA361_00670 [Bacteroidota bacterium]